MSYSFTIVASSREKAKAMVAAKLDEFMGQQPVHRFDRHQAEQAAAAYIDICEEPAGDKELIVEMQGSVSWNGSDTGHQVLGAGVRIAVRAVVKGLM